MSDKCRNSVCGNEITNNFAVGKNVFRGLCNRCNRYGLYKCLNDKCTNHVKCDSKYCGPCLKTSILSGPCCSCKKLTTSSFGTQRRHHGHKCGDCIGIAIKNAVDRLNRQKEAERVKQEKIEEERRRLQEEANERERKLQERFAAEAKKKSEEEAEENERRRQEILSTSYKERDYFLTLDENSKTLYLVEQRVRLDSLIEHVETLRKQLLNCIDETNQRVLRLEGDSDDDDSDCRYWSN
jgi:hypothetical protein